MTGWVEGNGRAMVRISVRPSPAVPPTLLEAWIDTGFSGELLVSGATALALGLTPSAKVTGELGDGSRVVMNTHTCFIDWFGQEKQIEVIADSGQVPLLGIGLLQHRKLTVDYPARFVEIQ